MKHPIRKSIVCLLAMCVAVLLLASAYYGFNNVGGERDNSRDAAGKLEAVTTTVSSLFSAYDECFLNYLNLLTNSAKLTVLPLTDIARQDGDAVIQNFGTACVVRKDGNRLILPEDSASIPPLEPLTGGTPTAAGLAACQPFEDEIGAFWSLRPSDGGSEEEQEFMLCLYHRIYEQYYYVQYTPLSEIEAYQLAHADVESVMRVLESSYNCLILGLYEEAGNCRLFHIPQQFEDHYHSLAELGISTGTDEPYGETEIDGERYVYLISGARPIADSKVFRIALLIPHDVFFTKHIEKGSVLIGTSLMIFTLMISWVLAVFGLVRREMITASQRERYSAGRVRTVAAAIGLIGTIVILLVSVFTDALSSLYYNTQICQADLLTLNAMMDDNLAREKRAADEHNELYLHYAKRAADLLAAYPELRTGEMLGKMSNIIGSDYLMVFDRYGRELVSDSAFVNLVYGTSEDSSTYDFRMLIKGVPSIIHEVCVDEATGLERQLIGVQIPIRDVSAGYPSLIMALLPDAPGNLVSAQDLMRSVTASGDLAFSLEGESGTIVQSIDEALVGKKASDLGMDENSFRDSFMDFFTLNGKAWYGCSQARAELIYYSAVPKATLFDSIWRDGLIRALIFMLIYLLLALVVLSGYNEQNLNKYGAKVVDDHEWITQQLNLKESEKRNPISSPISFARNWWYGKTPEAKTWFSFQVLMTVSLLILYRSINRGDVSIISYVLNGGWERGVNLFALCRILIFVAGAVMLIFFISLLVSLLDGILDTKGKTISRLLGSILECVIAIAALFFAFDVMGIDTMALLTSLGAFSLAISLGAKDLVADLFAGFGIVFSGKYMIGEKIELNNFCGRVCEVGIRTTTLLNEEGVIMQISNRDVSIVKNLSRVNSWIILQVSLSRDHTLDQIKAVANSELSEVGSRIAGLISGPEYLGVSAVDYVNIQTPCITLVITAECSEDQIETIRYSLIEELTRMFEDNGINVLKIVPNE